MVSLTHTQIWTSLSLKIRFVSNIFKLHEKKLAKNHEKELFYTLLYILLFSLQILSDILDLQPFNISLTNEVDYVSWLK